MGIFKSTVWVASLLLLLSVTGCKNRQTDGTKSEPVPVSQDDFTSEKNGEGEESGKELTIHQVYDEITKGTHLELTFDVEDSEFVGTIENVSDQLLDRVRVVVHLSNGTELGPATQVDLKPGEQREINLNAGDNSFITWFTHIEVGSGENSHEGEHDHQH